MSVVKLASRALIFVGLKLKVRFLESHFLVELVLVPPLSHSQPYLFLAIRNLPATHIQPHRIFPKWPIQPETIVSTKHIYIYISSNKYVLNRSISMEVRFNTFPFWWWWDNFPFQFLIILRRIFLSRGIARCNWIKKLSPAYLENSALGWNTPLVAILPWYIICTNHAFFSFLSGGRRQQIAKQLKRDDATMHIT